ncbi:MAG TPA: ArsA-related P-loop ATPase [Anaeromyxobacteraceae bacterium]|nr:ArsA-related P-loop ATPase [Anaeromyxobacteraceae bacterium]
MAGPALLERRLLVVTGKGGVGKSTVAAALALVAARRGKRVLVCEVNAQERIAPLLGAPPAGHAARLATDGVWTINVTPPEAMREYGIMVLRFRTIYDAVFENRVVRHFLHVIPSLAETVMLGKILHEVRTEENGRPRWDLVVLDAPATGHAVQLLRVPAALLDTVPPGPLRRDAQWMEALLVDPRTTAVNIVTLPEEMPVNEAIELDAQVRGTLGMPRGLLVVNAMPDDRFTPAEAAALGALARAPSPLGPAAEAARLHAVRREQAQRYVDRARAALDLPTAILPLLAVERWDRAAVQRIAESLGGAL